MKGAELERLVRDEEILRLRIEENLTYRQIEARLKEQGLAHISHVMVGKILNARIAASEANIQERREYISNMLEMTIKEARDKYQKSGYPSDLHALIKAIESYKNLWGLNAPSSHEITYRNGKMREIFDAVLVDAPQPPVELLELREVTDVD